MRRWRDQLRWHRAQEFLIIVGTLAAMACGGKDGRPSVPPPVEENSLGSQSRQTVLCLGTSLTAGLGLDPRESWPALIQAKVDSLDLPFRIINAGSSGETSAGALRRADWLFSQGPITVLIVETGANDGLRAQSTDSLAANLDALLSRAEALTPKPRILLAAMEALPNMGLDYAARFRRVYPAEAKAHGATLIPFLLNGVAGIDSLNQEDGLHPNVRGERLVAENIWRVLRPVLESMGR